MSTATDASSARTELRLTEVERRAWATDGFFIRECQFDAKEVDELRTAAESVAKLAGQAAAHASVDDYLIDGNRYVEATGSTVQFEHASGATPGGEGNPGSQTLRVIEPFHHLNPRLNAMLDDPRLVEPMKGLVRSDSVALWTDKLNLKRPREGSQFRYHQDSPYWTHACDHVDRLPNVMIALDDADEANGCFRVIRGSHTQGCLPGLHDETTLGPLFTDPDHYDATQEVAAAMPAGSLCFFSPHTVHGSPPNLSERPRRAMVVTYQPGGFKMFKVDAERAVGADASLLLQ